MMTYIPGNIPQKIQKQRCYLIENNFIIGLCKKRFADINTQVDYDTEVDHIDLNKGDIIYLRLFRYGYTSLYCYIDSVITDGLKKDYNTESIISVGFIELNGSIFRDITKSIERDKKILDILGG